MLGRWVVLAGLLAMAATARAEDVNAARQHFERGSTLYDLQRYLEAAKEYEAAYEAKHDPALLFNIGQAYRLGGDLTKAIGAYRSFLRRLPNARNRPEIEARVAELQKQLEEKGKAAPEPTPPNPPTEPQKSAPEPAPVAAPIAAPAPPAPTPAPAASAVPSPRAGRTKKIAGISVAAGGVAILAAGIGLRVQAQADYDEINSPAMGYRFQSSTQDQLKLFDPLSIAFLGIGSAAIVAGTTLAVLGWREGRARTVALVPSLSPGYAGAQLHLGF